MDVDYHRNHVGITTVYGIVEAKEMLKYNFFNSTCSQKILLLDICYIQYGLIQRPTVRVPQAMYSSGQ